MAPPIVIPAYQPDTVLLDLVRGVRQPVIVVDDGSGGTYQSIFSELEQYGHVSLLRHARNLGKGAALKTGLEFAMRWFPDAPGVVTADADGQHALEDILRVSGALSGDLVLGVRTFGADVPLRSRIGNVVTRSVLRVLEGQTLTDTQTGLRGIPMGLIPELLQISANGYEFELDMLVASKRSGWRVTELPIRTIYTDQNRSSHFNPIRDSLRIYFVLLRFTLVALITAAIDNAVFLGLFAASRNLPAAQAGARLLAMQFNYPAARRAVFHSHEPHSNTLPKYLFLVALSGTVSYLLIRMLAGSIGITAAKLAVESGLFFFNFWIQRDFVFRRRPVQTATDWNEYYRTTPATARLTRKYTSRVLVKMIRAARLWQQPVIAEIGGANSCFAKELMREFRPSAYHVYDTNGYGLGLLRGSAVQCHQESVLALSTPVHADLAFSVGLVEHFDPEDTRRAILAHFDLSRPGGLVIISFPTPTLLYRTARSICEAAGLWRFPDERPLPREEVVHAIELRGRVLAERTLWPLVFTQRMILARSFDDKAVDVDVKTR